MEKYNEHFILTKKTRQRIFVLLTAVLLSVTATSQVRFAAYYTHMDEGQDWETYSRTGEHADIVVKISSLKGELVFWRGNSYLPYWKTATGRWDIPEMIPRSGDGNVKMPDKANVYSYVKIIKNSASAIVIQWRYLARFAKGNPHSGVAPDNFVEETFAISPGGQVKREIRRGTQKIDDWNDSSYRTIQILQLTQDGLRQVSVYAPKRSFHLTRITGNPVHKPSATLPSLSFSFDEGIGDSVASWPHALKVAVPGNRTIWKKGVSGTALELDGYSTGLVIPFKNAGFSASGSITLAGWIALGAYPWNWAPVVQQGDSDGWFLGVDSHGYPGFMIRTDTAWEQLTVPNQPPYTGKNHFALFRWYFLAGTYDKEQGMMRLYIDGQEVASKAVGKNTLHETQSEIRIGKAGILRTPTEGTHDTYPSNFGLDGLIDEVQVFNSALDPGKLAMNYRHYLPGNSVIESPDLPRRAFPKPSTNGQFKAIYTHLPYYEIWENMFRFGSYPDVVVGFDQLPVKYVFWRGVSYIPMIVNESGQWFTNQFDETGFTKEAPGDCEPMSDKGCWDSQVRIIENSQARVVVNWRYRQADPSHHWANYDSLTGWGDMSDWDYYIYPDGVATKVMRWYSSRPGEWHEWDEQIAVLGEGQHPEKVLQKTPVMTLVDTGGRMVDYDWNPDPPKPAWNATMIQKIYYTGKFSPYSIQYFTNGDLYEGERTGYSVFPSWNHWPTAQINSSGRNASFPDRASHSSISHLYWPLYREQSGKTGFQEKILLEGMTDQPANSLTALAKSWLNAPPVNKVSGAVSSGYDQGRRAYCFQLNSASMTFQIAASEVHPVHNLCFEVRNWNSPVAHAVLRINGVYRKAGPQFRQGTMIDTDGSYTLLVWLEMDATSSQMFEISKLNNAAPIRP